VLRVLVLASVLAGAPIAPAGAFSGGVDSSAVFPPVGCGGPEGASAGCHVTVANPELVVTLDGPVSIEPVSGGSGAYTASIPTGAFGRLGAGVNVAIGSESTSDCELDGVSPLLARIGNLLTHVGDSSPPLNLVGVFSYDFQLVNCTVPGAVVLHAAMNGFDGSGDQTGEVWNGTQLAVTVPEPGATGLALGAAVALAALRGSRRR
jgi:hypothetical protein